MNGFIGAAPWGYRILFLWLAILFLFLKLLPLGSAAGGFPGPDLLLCMSLAWVMRRPDYLPVALVALVVFVEDLILMRPPGLWTAFVVMGTEFIRARIALTRELNFLVEWLLVAGLMVAMLLGYRLVYMLTFLPQEPFAFAVIQVFWSVMAYPVVVVASRLVLDLRKPGTGETDDFGRRL
ncbi:rod shape-determining protein MreD [Xinfangfangia sp. CPCC 101601]|uniref:Rod shape-determining protein MreD n=1 Tax=Pseudogemmobacter lacusdianii TaxID=3069608 RepID=A0ABU0VWF8_9RHOB|nr:rod shape-determining protein MreD [Xinfangfangia sp. CPCC 101601]MDQ2066072.1 rod shape-determining protein MreD [Xinfangfangia sp. CPCC 101601]